ncbi:MAG TPA: DUF4097 family beta strand repeat-containing protein [Anaerolineales bacterium]|nr:DUF4097 family beta strand repeat-containing protein [Anaerolineales bacterium]
MNKKKSTGLIVAAVGLAVISIFCVLTVIGIVNWIQRDGGSLQFFTNDTYKATAYETLTIDADDLTGLEFDLDFSDIEITESTGNQITLDLVKTGWAASEEEAQETAETLTLDQSKRGSTITFSIPRSPEGITTFGQNRADTIDIALSVPKDMDISILLSSGHVTATDYQGGLAVDNNFGNTTITNFQGSLSIDGSNGKITLDSVDLTEPFSLTTDFGEINITDLHAPEIEIKNQNGALTLKQLYAEGDCQLSSDFTDIEVDTIECASLTVESNNGPIELNHGLITGPLAITTDFGNLTIKDVTAESYDFSSRNGIIYANSLQGKVTIDADFGNIELYGKEDVSLEVEGQNGDIFFQGKLNPESTHTITSDFGKIEVRIPASSAFDISLATDFGKIETDLPITLSGTLDASKMEGQINGGGPLLKLESQNGDIILTTLEN